MFHEGAGVTAVGRDDRSLALDWAERARGTRTGVRDDLSTGSRGLGDVLTAAGADQLLGQVRLLWVLESCPGARKVDTRRTLAALGLDERLQLGRLSPDQRSVVLSSFPTDRQLT